MFGRILGSIVSAPIRLINIPVKITEKVVQASDEFILGKSDYSYKAPRRNTLDKIANSISKTCEESFDE